MFKKIAITLLVIFVLLIGALVAIPFIFKDKLLKIAKDEINKPINAQVDFGDIGLSVFKSFPHLTFTLEDVSVVGIAPFAGDTLAAISAFSVHLDIMSVIKGETIDIRGINLDKPRIKVLVNEEGIANYDIAKPSEAKPGADAAAQETELSIKLRSYSISKGDIVYNDKASGLMAEIHNLDHSGSGDFTLDVFDLKTLTKAEAVTVVSGGVKYLNSAELELKIDLGMDLPNNLYNFKENSFRINKLVLGLDGNVVLVNDSTYNLDVSFAAKQTAFKDVLSLVPAIYAKDFESIQTSGELALSGFAKGVYAGENYPAFGLKLNVDNAMFKYPDLPTAVNDIFINVAVDNPGGDLDKTLIDVSRFDLKLGQERFSMKLKVKYPVSDPDFDAKVVGKIDLGQVTNYYPLSAGEKISGLVDANASAKGRMSAVTEERYNDLVASGRVGVSNLNYVSPDIPEGTSVENLLLVFASEKGSGAGLQNLNANATLDIKNLNYRSSDLPSPVRIETAKMAISPKSAALSAFKAVVGKSDFTARGNVENLMDYLFSDGTIKGTLSVNSNYLDLNEWMTESETPAAQTQDTTTVTIAEVPANIDFTLTTAIGKVLYDNIELKNVSGNVEVKDQVVKLSFLKANLLDGEMVINGTYSAKDNGQPKVDFGYDLKNIDIQQAYKTFNTVEKIAPIAKHITGRFNSNLKMTAKLGNDMSLDVNSIVANGKIGLNNAKLSDFKVLNILADKLKMNQLRTMVIQDSWTVFQVVDGRVHVEPFDVKVQPVTMNVSGSNGLDQTLDYDLVMSVPRNLLGAANDYINDLLNKSPIPGLNASTLPDVVKFTVKVTGTMTDPKVGIGMAKGNDSSLKDKAKEEFDKAKAEVVRRAKEEGEKIMREAEAQAAKIRGEARVLADRTTKEGYAQAKKQVDQISNPLAKVAAQKAADVLKKETDKKAKQIIDDADKRAQKVVDDARVKASQVQ